MTSLVLQGPNLTSDAANEIAAKLQASVKLDTNYAVIELSQITDSDIFNMPTGRHCTTEPLINA